MTQQTFTEWLKDAPIAIGGSLTLFGFDLNNWVLIFTLAWAAWRLFTAVMDFYWKWKDRKDGSKRQDPGETARKAGSGPE